MSDKHPIENATELEAKKLKVDSESPFVPVGSAVEQIDAQPGAADLQDQSESHGPEVIESKDLRTTGAADSEGRPVQEIDSLCMNCHETGVTKLLLTSIPFFKEVIIMSFECPHCGFKNSEIQPAGDIQEKGVKYILQVTDKADLNRQVIKSESCVCKFSLLDLEIPAKRGQLTTVEGLLQQVVGDLEADQPARKAQDENVYQQIEQFIAKVKQVIAGEMLPIHFYADDPAGNSYVEFIPGEASHKWSRMEYFRTKEQSRALGMNVPDDEDEYAGQDQKERNASIAKAVEADENNDNEDIENLRNEVHTFPATCPSCYVHCETRMKVVDIPHFKEVIIMSTVCDHCGYKSNEVKTGGAIPDKGRKISLKVDDPEDLARDILKSETCGLTIPELNLDLTPGTLGGRFTTLEGLLTQVHDELNERVFNETSDSMEATTKANWERFLQRLQEAISGNMKFTVIMEDPLAASYIQNVYAPDPDPNMEIEDYTRTEEQNESLGLNDMKV